MPITPSYRRPLNPKQLAILKLFYRFRFATTNLIAQTLNISQRKAHQRLQILLDQGYIARRDEAGFRLPGQFAVYFLKPKGVAALTDLPDDPRSAALQLRLAHDHDRSDRFIQHCLGLFEIYCDLSTHFGERLRFFTKPLRAAIARINQFDEYADDGDWLAATRTSVPKTIFVIEKPSLQKKIIKFIDDELDNNPLLRVTSKGEVVAALDTKR